MKINSRLNTSLLMLERVLHELDQGFVLCNRCGDQEDTKDLDCVDDLKNVRNELLALQKEIDGAVND